MNVDDRFGHEEGTVAARVLSDLRFVRSLSASLDPPVARWAQRWRVTLTDYLTALAQARESTS